MLKRPTRRETEDDLLQQQRDFLKSQDSKNVVEEQGEVVDERPFHSKTCGIIGNVIEKNGNNAIRLDGPQTVSDGFPTLFRLDPSSKWVTDTKKKKSLFAQKLKKAPSQEQDFTITDGELFQKENLTEKDLPLEECNLDKNLSLALQNYSKDNVTKKQSRPDIPPDEEDPTKPIDEEIHEENLKKIANMTAQEIHEEAKSLQENFSPDLLNFLKKRGSKKQSEQKSPAKCLIENPTDDSLTQNLLQTIDKEFLEMDKIEPEKLQWIGDIPNATSLEPGETYSARFNFTGDLQPFKTEIDVRKSLHHHGEEPDRPGYTIQELYQLSRSTVLQQRILALNTLANIIRKTKMGYYDSCFDGALLKKLVDSDLFFLLRFSMDDRATTAAAVNCLHELFVSRSDEVCLDRLLNFSLDNCEPFIYVRIETDSDTKEDELKDDQIIAQDLVRGVLRTDLLVRFSYVLNFFEVDSVTVSKIFDIVIRVCRHSPETCRTVFESTFMSHVVSNVNNSNQACHNGVKLLRVLASSSGKVLHEMSEKIDFRFLMRIIDMDEPLFKLKLECLALWRLFLRNNLLTELFQNFTPVLCRLLSFYEAHVNIIHGRFDFELFSGIVSILNAVLLAKNAIEPTYVTVLQVCFRKWISQLISLDWKMNYSVAKALGAVLNFFVIKYDQNMDTFDLIFLKNIEFLNNLVDHLDSIFENLMKFSHTACFGNVVRDPENLPSLCSVYQNGENYLKSVHDESLWPFIEPLAEFLLKIDSILEFCPLVRLKEKLERFAEVFWTYPETSSWFGRYELGVLLATLKIKKKLGDDDLLQFAFRLIPYFRTDDDRVLSILQIVSHPYVSEVFQNHLSETLTKMHYHCCENFPKHWMYEPILAAPLETLQCLTTILEHCPDLLSKVSPALRFCHICLLLLDGENIFVPEIRKNLEICFQDVLLNLDQLDISLVSISDKTFYELYRDLAIEYASCSYGDQLFAKIVTLPLCQRFDVSYRKLMWSEMMHALRVISLPNSENFVSVDVFTTPVETDESLLVLYLNAVSNNVLSEERNGFLYAVAVENLRKYLNCAEKDKNVALFLKHKISNAKNEKLKNYLLT